jgi:hypothetical protein
MELTLRQRPYRSIVLFLSNKEWRRKENANTWENHQIDIFATKLSFEDDMILVTTDGLK